MESEDKSRNADDMTPHTAVRESHLAQITRLAKNSLANLLRLGANWLVLLVVPPLLVRLLDRPAYATWMLVLQLGAYATLFDGGLQLAIGRYVARAEYRRDRHFMSELLSGAAALLIAASIAVCILTGIAALSLGHLFHSIPAALLPQARAALLLVGGSIGLAFPSSVLAGYFLGLEKNHFNAFAGGASKIAGAAGTVWAALHHQGLAVMAAWTAAGVLMQPFIFILAGWRFGLHSLLRAKMVKLRTVMNFGRFCSAMIVSQLGMLLITGLDIPVVVAYDFRNAGYYALAATVSNMLVVPHGAILSTIVPMMSSRSAGESSERMGEILLRTTRLASVILLLVTVPLMLGMPVFLNMWIGSDYARHTLILGELLVGAQFIRLILLPYSLIGFSAGEQNKMLVSPVVEGIVNLSCSLFLVHISGAIGVAVGTLIGAFAGNILHFLNSMPRTRSMAFRRRKLLWEAVFQPILWAAGPALIAVALLHRADLLILKLLLLSGLVIVLVILFWTRCLQPEDKMAFQALGARMLPGILRPGQAGI